MSFKNLVKKVALVTGSVALLSAAGGAVSANAAVRDGNSFVKPVTAKNVPNPVYRTFFNEIANPAVNGTEGTDGTSSVSYKGNHYGMETNGADGPIYGYENGHRVPMTKVDRDLGAAENSNSSAIDTSASDSDETNGNANDYQAGNTNNGKLVQTGENNGAEYTAVAGAILTVSAVAFAGYDIRKND